jgi:ribonuclease P protein component
VTAVAVALGPAASHRLRLPADIRAVFAARSVAHGPSVVVHAARRDDGAPARWTVVAGRKVGDAVDRNRAKRRLREALHSLALPTGVDLVVVARPAARTVPYAALQEELTRLVEKAVGRHERRAGSAR